MNASRRHFLRSAAGFTAAAAPLMPGFSTPLAMSLAGLGALAHQQAHAADVNGYRALVCLFMNGGNDGHNWIVPLDSTGFADYTKARGELALASNRFTALSASGQAAGRQFGLVQELEPLRSWYESGQLAALANVGPLERPITVAEYRAGGAAVPTKLFSHNDQQSIWQSLAPEGAPSGWGGRMGDLLQAANGMPVLTAVSAAGNAVFLTGRSVLQYQVGPEGPIQVDALNRQWVLGSQTVGPILRKTMLASGSSPFQSEYARVTQRSFDTASRLTQALAATTIPALPSSTVTLSNGSALRLDSDPLARQLRIVARMIAAGAGLGMKRQVFLVSAGGFDTHANQLRDHPLLTARVACSVDWFLNRLKDAGLLANTTLFTASDFGRTLTSNGSGSDHGWGSHHLIAGGAVKGRAIYGTFPVTSLGTTTDIGSGRLLPTTSVTEYAATLGRWMGLTPGELTTVLPNLGSFATPNLGFLA
jgi:uncharacterized protein (DUF1501 family)